MTFRPANLDAHVMKFNSASSATLVDIYEKATEAEIRAEESAAKHRTFAPSQFRCKRLNWFRLRGTAPDAIQNVDPVLDFSAKIGESCHELIQRRLRNALHKDWITVEEYFLLNPPDFKYTLERKGEGLETFVEIQDPPVRFACDGIVRLNGKLFLVEIKSSEYSSFIDLVEPKSYHVDQVKCYASLFNIEDVLMIYIDRQYGAIKCFEVKVSLADRLQVREDMKDVQRYVGMNIAPDGLPKGDNWCKPNMCPYYKVCKEWGGR